MKQKVTKNVLGHEELHQCLDDGWYSIDGFLDTNIVKFNQLVVIWDNKEELSCAHFLVYGWTPSPTLSIEIRLKVQITTSYLYMILKYRSIQPDSHIQSYQQYYDIPRQADMVFQDTHPYLKGISTFIND